MRTTSAAAAPPKSRSIGGAGTGAGPPDEVPLDPPQPPRPQPWLLEPWPLELQPLLLLQPLEPWLDEPLLLEP
ncbi:MAG: hypothetical protein V4808_13425 [Pseudomonadota bacterium]